MATSHTAPPEDVNLLKLARAAVSAYRRSHYTPAAQHDDLLSDACLGAVKATRSHDPALGCSLASWVFQRAYSEIQDGVRRRGPITRTNWAAGLRDPNDLPEQQQPPVPLEHAGWVQQVPDPTDRYAEVDDALDDTTRALVARLLVALPDRERQVIQRRYLAGEQCQAIATDLGVTPARVSQILSTARTLMRAAA